MKIGLLSRGANLYSTKSLFDAGRERGHEMDIFSYGEFQLMIEPGKSLINYIGDKIEHYDAIIPRIGASNNLAGLQVIRMFENQDVFSTVSSSSLTKARDKIYCHLLFAKENILFPKTYFAQNLYDNHELFEYLPPPFVVKYVEGTHGQGVTLVKNEEMAKPILELFKMSRKPFFVQEFVPEANGEDVRAFVVGNEVVAAMKRKSKPGDFRSNLHQGGSAIHIKLTSKEEEVAIQCAKLLGLGVAGVDMLQSHDGPKVLEVNPSPGLEGIESTTGVNIAEKIIQFIEKSVV